MTEQNNEQPTQEHKGRQAGVPNKLTAKLREQIGDLIEVNMEQLVDDIPNMKPTDRAQVMLKLMDFVMPKLKAVEFVDNTPKDKDTKFGIQFTGVPTGFTILTAPNNPE